MDIIILAAGKNERLKGIVPPFHKPLLVINGRPLITQLVEAVRSLTSLHATPGVTPRIIIVCAPQNISALTAVLPMVDNMLFVIQREADGVLNAVRTGLAVATDTTAMLLCADNIIALSTWSLEPFYRESTTDHDALYVHGQFIPAPEVERFTYFSDGKWFEKTSVVGSSPAQKFCWLGPLVFNTALMRDAIDRFSVDYPTERQSVGRVFNYYTGNCWTIVSDALDIGLPENLQ
jgi:molybdopterin-guanine dinucleotide biosynthesis protein A